MLLIFIIISENTLKSLIERNILHYWKMCIFTVREGYTNRLYEKWEKYVHEKLRHKEMKEYLCKAKSVLQYLVA